MLGAPVISVTIPIATVSEANRRDHFMVKAKRAKAHRNAAWMLCPRYPLPCVVTLTRVGARILDDDNLRSALKSTRDGLADRLGVKDNSPLIEWRYAQAKGKPAVVVEFAERAQ